MADWFLFDATGTPKAEILNFWSRWNCDLGYCFGCVTLLDGKRRDLRHGRQATLAEKLKGMLLRDCQLVSREISKIS